MTHHKGRSARSYDAEIDSALSLLTRATPAEGLEQRVHGRLAEAGAKANHRPSNQFWAMCAFAGNAPRNLACAASLAATVLLLAGALAYHSNHFTSAPFISVVPPPADTMPRPASHAAGFGAAAAIRVTPPAMKPSFPLRGRRHGRAWISSHHKPLPAGVAVPKSPLLARDPSTPVPDF